MLSHIVSSSWPKEVVYTLALSLQSLVFQILCTSCMLGPEGTQIINWEGKWLHTGLILKICYYRWHSIDSFYHLWDEVGEKRQKLNINLKRWSRTIELASKDLTCLSQKHGNFATYQRSVDQKLSMSFSFLRREMTGKERHLQTKPRTPNFSA